MISVILGKVKSIVNCLGLNNHVFTWLLNGERVLGARVVVVVVVVVAGRLVVSGNPDPSSK